MENEYKFQLTIAPEDYNYDEEEIVYRIYFDDQLISERSLPKLQIRQAINDNFILKLDDKIEKNLIFYNVASKKAIVKTLKINDFSFNNFSGHILFSGISLFLKSL